MKSSFPTKSVQSSYSTQKKTFPAKKKKQIFSQKKETNCGFTKTVKSSLSIKTTKLCSPTPKPQKKLSRENWKIIFLTKSIFSSKSQNQKISLKSQNWVFHQIRKTKLSQKWVFAKTTKQVFYKTVVKRQRISLKKLPAKIDIID